jgi:hypothetical protein
MKKHIVFVALILLLPLVSGCFEANEDNATIDASTPVCQSASDLVSTTRTELIDKVKLFSPTRDLDESQTKYKELISIFEVASKNVIECQLSQSKSGKQIDCDDCLVDLFMNLQGIDMYLSSNLIGKRPLLILDLELIQLQIQE